MSKRIGGPEESLNSIELLAHLCDKQRSWRAVERAGPETSLGDGGKSCDVGDGGKSCDGRDVGDGGKSCDGHDVGDGVAPEVSNSRFSAFPGAVLTLGSALFLVIYISLVTLGAFADSMIIGVGFGGILTGIFCVLGSLLGRFVAARALRHQNAEKMRGEVRLLSLPLYYCLLGVAVAMMAILSPIVHPDTNLAVAGLVGLFVTAVTAPSLMRASV